MRDAASKDEKLLKQAQERAKIVLEENIRQVGNLKTGEYTINWNLK